VETKITEAKSRMLAGQEIDHGPRMKRRYATKPKPLKLIRKFVGTRLTPEGVRLTTKRMRLPGVIGRSVVTTHPTRRREIGSVAECRDCDVRLGTASKILMGCPSWKGKRERNTVAM
jgi:hypothetical protein